MMKTRDRFDSLFRFYLESVPRIPWRWAKAQGIAESNLNPYAVSPVGAVGLMQFMPDTWAEIAGPTKDRRDPDASIQAYSIYMPRIMDFLGSNDLERATAAYNWGMGRVRNAGESWRDLMPTETVKYLRRIKQIYGELCAETV